MHFRKWQGLACILLASLMISNSFGSATRGATPVPTPVPSAQPPSTSVPTPTPTTPAPSTETAPSAPQSTTKQSTTKVIIQKSIKTPESPKAPEAPCPPAEAPKPSCKPLPKGVEEEKKAPCAPVKEEKPAPDKCEPKPGKCEPKKVEEKKEILNQTQKKEKKEIQDKIKQLEQQEKKEPEKQPEAKEKMMKPSCKEKPDCKVKPDCKEKPAQMKEKAKPFMLDHFKMIIQTLEQMGVEEDTLNTYIKEGKKLEEILKAEKISPKRFKKCMYKQYCKVINEAVKSEQITSEQGKQLKTAIKETIKNWLPKK